MPTRRRGPKPTQTCDRRRLPLPSGSGRRCAVAPVPCGSTPRPPGPARRVPAVRADSVGSGDPPRGAQESAHRIEPTPDHGFLQDGRRSSPPELSVRRTRGPTVPWRPLRDTRVSLHTGQAPCLYHRGRSCVFTAGHRPQTAGFSLEEPTQASPAGQAAEGVGLSRAGQRHLNPR